MQEVVDNSFKAIITAIAADGLDESWLGRNIDETFLKDIKIKTITNIAGEGGEFESSVLDCPLFKKKINIIMSRKEMDSENSGRLIIEKAELIEK